MTRSIYLAGLILSVPIAPLLARADSESCASAQAEGQRSSQQRHLLDAQSAYARCAQDDCPQAIRQDCASRQHELRVSSPSLVVQVVDSSGQPLANARVETESGLGPMLADGRSFALDPGPQVLLVSAPGRKSARQLVSVREGEHDRVVRVELAPALTMRLEGPLLTPGPNVAAPLALGPGRERLARTRRLKLATYGLTVSGLAVGSWALASGLRGRQIEQDCASEASCSEGFAAHGRMLYRSANAGATIGVLCGASAAVLLWRWLTEASPESWHSASSSELPNLPTGHWQF